MAQYKITQQIVNNVSISKAHTSFIKGDRRDKGVAKRSRVIKSAKLFQVQSNFNRPNDHEKTHQVLKCTRLRPSLQAKPSHASVDGSGRAAAERPFPATTGDAALFIAAESHSGTAGSGSFILPAEVRHSPSLLPLHFPFPPLKSLAHKFTRTRSSAIAEGPRDASCQLKSCQLPRNSAETTYTTSPDQIDGMKLEI